MEQLSGVSASPSRSADFQSISICPNRRRPRESLVLVVVLVLVIGNGEVEDEDEKEDEDDLVAAGPRCAVSQVFNLPPAAREQRSADYKSAIRQIKNLRYAKQIPCRQLVLSLVVS